MTHLSPKRHRDPPTSPPHLVDGDVDRATLELTPEDPHVHDGRWCWPCVDHGARAMLDGMAEAETVRRSLRRPTPVRWAWLGLGFCLRVPSMRDRWSRAERRPISRGCTIAGLAACLAVIATALLLVGSSIVDATPRSAAVIQPAGTSGAPPSAGAASATPDDVGRQPTGAPAAGTPQPRSEATRAPSAEAAGPRYTAQATWCAPTPTHCQGWGGADDLYAAVRSFTDGDQPYWVTVWRGTDHVDVLVVSYCACQDRDDRIDLSPAAFAALAPLTLGRVDVEVELLPPGHLGPPPSTDTEDQSGDDPPPDPADDRMRLEALDEEAYR